MKRNIKGKVIKYCPKCNRENIPRARYCGACGYSLQMVEAVYLPLFYKPVKRAAFGGAVLAAVSLLLFGGVLAYSLFNGLSSVRASARSFSDVPLDHPIYTFSPKLIASGALLPRKNDSLSPFEAVSSSEWNFSLDAASKSLGCQIPSGAYCDASSKELSVDDMNKKLKILGFSGEPLPTSARIAAFYALERTLMK